MDFTYDNLQDAWLHDVRIGNWKGKPVYSVRKDHINEECVNGVYYVVFDDGYKIIGIDSSNRLKEYGSIDRNGNVDEHFAPLKYSASTPPARVKETPVVKKEIPATEAVPRPQVEEPTVVADVKLEINVDEVLQAARVMTVDSLLEGFNYGLD